MGAGHGLGGQVARHPRPLRLRGGGGGVVVLSEHLHVAAQRQDADPVFGLTPGETRQLETADVEPEKKLLTLHSAGLGDEEVAEFVDEDHETQASGDLEHHPPVRGFRKPLQPAGPQNRRHGV